MRLGLGRRDARAAVEALFGGVAEALRKGRSVSIVGFGAWEWTERPARRVHDPRNMKKIDLPGRRKLTFKPSETFKRRLNEGKQ
jgi:DNA-binding protein HU-beta